MFRLHVACALLVGIAPMVFAPSASAQNKSDRVPSTCLAVAENLNGPELPVHYASLRTIAGPSKYDVTISYQGHSTYLIESPEGVKIATDFAGWLTDRVVPDVVTMNQAHSSHYTDFPNPEIKIVLKGWGDGLTPADHNVMVGDTLIRNVTTDIIRWQKRPDGNSIFIFEAGGLCIGHLGHLHHRLSESQYTKIGRLDVVMIAVDGGLTMTHVSAKEILERLRSSVILPMHLRSYDALPRFLAYLGSGFPVERLPKNRLTLSLRNLPKQPTVMLLPGVGNYSPPDE